MFSWMGEALNTLTVSTIANFDHFRAKTHILHTKALLSCFLVMFLYPNPGKKVGNDMLKYILDFKIGFSWMGDALPVPTIAKFDHFERPKHTFYTQKHCYHDFW